MEKMVRWLPFPGKERIVRTLLGRRRDAVDVDIRTCSRLTLRVPSLREPIAFHLYCNGIYEPETIDVILALLPRNGTFVDIGANIGAIALDIAIRRPDARIIAIEPSPAVLPYLTHNITHNRITNVHLEALAASDREGEIDFYLPPSAHFGMASAAPQFGVEPVRVRAQTLDAILASIAVSNVSVIKIDAEGAELDVIRGAARLLSADDAPALIFEFVDWAEARLHRPGDAQRELMRLGYDLTRLDGRRAPIGTALETGGAMILAQKSPDVGTREKPPEPQPKPA
jgi:FkbM family methyltransferase